MSEYSVVPMVVWLSFIEVSGFSELNRQGDLVSHAGSVEGINRWWHDQSAYWFLFAIMFSLTLSSLVYMKSVQSCNTEYVNVSMSYCK